MLIVPNILMRLKLSLTDCRVLILSKHLFSTSNHLQGGAESVIDRNRDNVKNAWAVVQHYCCKAASVLIS